MLSESRFHFQGRCLREPGPAKLPGIQKQTLSGRSASASSPPIFPTVFVRQSREQAVGEPPGVGHDTDHLDATDASKRDQMRLRDFAKTDDSDCPKS